MAMATGIYVRLSRRGFITGASGLAAASLLAGCAQDEDASAVSDDSESENVNVSEDDVAETATSAPEIEVTGGTITPPLPCSQSRLPS